MKLAPRLILAFGFLAAVSSAGLGVVLREDRRLDETRRFDEEVRSACARVASEVQRQAEADRKLVAGACQSGELVDRALVAIDSGDLDERRLALSALVPKEREAFDLDEMILFTDAGDVLGADPRTLLATPRATLDAQLRGDSAKWQLRSDASPAVLARCTRHGRTRQSVGLLGARLLAPLLERYGNTAGVKVVLGTEGGAEPGVAQASCAIVDPAGGTDRKSTRLNSSHRP